MERKLITLILLLAFSFAFAQFEHSRVYTTFDDIPLPKTDTFLNGADMSGGFSHYDRFFNNKYDTAYGGSWTGWALSNRTDDTTQGFGNQYSAIPGHGLSYTDNYMVGFSNPSITFDSAIEVSGAYFTNNAYAYYDMKHGSGFSKKFGGTSGDDPDYLKVIINLYSEGFVMISVDFYLADFRSTDNSKDYILDDWTYVDFNAGYGTGLPVDSIVFMYESSDSGDFGMNTPAYFCMDDFNAQPNVNHVDDTDSLLAKDTFDNGANGSSGFNIYPYFYPNSYNPTWNSWSGWSVSSMYDDTTAGFTNQYSSIVPPNDLSFFHLVNSGVVNEIRSPYKFRRRNYFLGRGFQTYISFSITNATYAYFDMLNGSGFSKKFGGADGNDPDYFRLLVRSVDDSNNILFTDTLYLADYRFTDNSKDYILKQWREIEIVDCDKLTFELESSDIGAYGMNTPAFFCLNYREFIYRGINETQKETVVNLYPNPATNLITLQAEENIEGLNVYSLNGQLISNMDTEIWNKNASIDVSSLANGIYFVEVRTENGVITKRLIKQ